MKHKELSELWSEHYEKMKEWERALLRTSETLRERLEDILDPQEKTFCLFFTNHEYRYIEVGIPGEDEFDLNPLTAKNILEEGFLLFTIRVTFDNGPSSYPKQYLFTEICSRIRGNNEEFCIFDIKTRRPDKNWTSNLDSFCETLISSYKNYFTYDPFTGFTHKQPIGFLSLQNDQ